VVAIPARFEANDPACNPGFYISFDSTIGSRCARLMQGDRFAGDFMQQTQSLGAAGQSPDSWYLARGDKRFGPLGNRELLLLAQRGGLKTDDLLWKPGFESWKPVRDVCDMPALAAPHEPSVVDVAAAGATGAEDVFAAGAGVDERPAPKVSLKSRLAKELRELLTIFAYLWFVFLVFFVHEWIVLAGHNIGFRFYGLAAVNALVLGKIMLIAENMRFAERFQNRPLIVPVVYKSVAFALLLMAAYIVEEIALGVFHGKTAAESLPQLGSGGVVAMACVVALMAVALVPFFAFREIARVVGEAEFRTLIFGAGKHAEDRPPTAAATEPV
jgi:hypothetical protein